MNMLGALHAAADESSLANALAEADYFSANAFMGSLARALDPAAFAICLKRSARSAFALGWDAAPDVLGSLLSLDAQARLACFAAMAHAPAAMSALQELSAEFAAMLDGGAELLLAQCEPSCRALPRSGPRALASALLLGAALFDRAAPPDSEQMTSIGGSIAPFIAADGSSLALSPIGRLLCQADSDAFDGILLSRAGRLRLAGSFAELALSRSPLA